MIPASSSSFASFEPPEETRLLVRGSLGQDGRRDPLGKRDNLGLLHAVDGRAVRGLVRHDAADVGVALVVDTADADTHGTLAGGTT